MAKLIDSLSAASTKTELDLFHVPPTQIAVEHCRWKEINLRNACTNEGPYEFHISPDPQMLHLSKNFLFMELRIRHADGTNLVTPVAAIAGDTVAPINLLGKTFIKQIKVMLNGTEVFNSGDKYAYRAFLETELNYGTDAKNSQLQAMGYMRDAGNNIDAVGNTGFLERGRQYRESTVVQLMAPIHCDLFCQNRYLLNNVDLRIMLYRNSDAFCLMSYDQNPDFKIEVNTMRWYVKGIDVMKSIGLGLERTLMHYTAKYPVRRVEIKTLHVGAGRRETPENSLFSGQIPRRVVIGCVDADAYHGTYGKSPFNFKHYNIHEVSITAGGETVPSKPLTMDFEHNLFTRAYVQLFEALGIGSEDKGNSIDMKSFKNGSCLFAFDLSPDEEDGSHWDLVKDGTTSINMQFVNAIVGGGIEIIVYAEFDSLITMDRNRNVYTDYKA